MERRPVGDTRVETTQVTLGTWGLAAESYGPVEEDRFSRVVQQALEAGVETFDMAPAWGAGRSERIVAKAVADARPECTYITRAGATVRDGSWEADFSASALERQCDASLERLNTDRIDVWLLHNPSAATIHSESERLRELAAALKSDGRIRSFGASVVTTEQALAALDMGVDVLCCPYNAVRRTPVDDVSEKLKSKNVSLLARSILNYGLLSGRWGEARKFAEGDHRAERWNASALRVRVKQAESLRFLVRGDVGSLVAAAVRFALAQESVASAIIGPRSTGQLLELLRACKDGPPYLPAYDLERIGRILTPMAGNSRNLDATD